MYQSAATLQHAERVVGHSELTVPLGFIDCAAELDSIARHAKSYTLTGVLPDC
jgi:hypothetical protein